jgi:hypothetical protein
MRKQTTRAHTDKGELFLKVLGLIKVSGASGITTADLMEKSGLSRRSIQNHTSDLRLRGYTVSAGHCNARVHLTSDHGAKVVQKAAEDADAAWRAAQEPIKAIARQKRLDRQKAYCKEWRKTGPVGQPKAKPKAKAEAQAANTVAKAIKVLDRKPWEPKPKPLPPTVTWCAPDRHYKEPTKPGRYEVLEVAGCFSALPPNVYPFEPASVAARGVS